MCASRGVTRILLERKAFCVIINSILLYNLHSSMTQHNKLVKQRDLCWRKDNFEAAFEGDGI